MEGEIGRPAEVRAGQGWHWNVVISGAPAAHVVAGMDRRALEAMECASCVPTEWFANLVCARAVVFILTGMAVLDNVTPLRSQM